MTDKLGGVIQTFRERAKLTQDELGRRIGVSQQTIAKWEAGKSKPRPKALENLISVLKIDGSKLRAIGASTTISIAKHYGPSNLADQMLRDPEISNFEELEPGSFSALPASFPSEARFNVGANAVALKRMIAPVVKEIDPSGAWDQFVQGNWGNWHVDYMSDELYAQILPAPTPSALALHLNTTIYRYLWQYAVLSRQDFMPKRHSRYRLIVIAMPEDQSLNLSDVALDSDDAQDSDGTNERLLQRVSDEALHMGIYIALARTPSDVVSLLTDPSSI